MKRAEIEKAKEFIREFKKRQTDENWALKMSAVAEMVAEYAQLYQSSQKAEVPTDEEIEKEARRLYPKRDIHRHAFKKGVKWRDNFTPSSESDKLKEAIINAHMAGQHDSNGCDPSYCEALAYYNSFSQYAPEEKSAHTH